MKLGVLIAGTRPAHEAARLAARAEAVGFDEVWLSEDYCERGAFAVAGAIAAATDHVAVGLGVLNPWTRHPLLTAMEFAALDEIAEGRAILGMGASNRRWMEGDLGISFERPLTRLRESIDILRAALAGEDLDHDGDAYCVRAGLSFRPIRSDPLIMLGVKGRRALALAGEISDGVVLSILSSPAYVQWALEQVGQPLLSGSYVAFACDPDGDAARDRIRPLVARFLGVHGQHDITRVAGLDPELANRFRAALLDGQPAVDLVSDELITTFAVAGDPEECTRGVHRFAEVGLGTFIVRDLGDGDPEQLLRQAVDCAGRAEVR